MKPFNRLKNVVLPAPFGPMMPRSLRSTFMLTSRTAEGRRTLSYIAHLEYDRAVAAFLAQRQFRDDCRCRAADCVWRRASRSPAQHQVLHLQNTPSGASRMTATIAIP
jgi:hypothetical protein